MMEAEIWRGEASAEGNLKRCGSNVKRARGKVKGHAGDALDALTSPALGPTKTFGLEY